MLLYKKFFVNKIYLLNIKQGFNSNIYFQIKFLYIKFNIYITKKKEK